jgi:hypothetical protein
MLTAVAAELQEAAAAVVLVVVQEEVADCAARDIKVGQSLTATTVRHRLFSLPYRGGSTTLLFNDCAVIDINVGRYLTATKVRHRSFSLAFQGNSTTLLVVVVILVVKGGEDCGLLCAMAALPF